MICRVCGCTDQRGCIRKAALESGSPLDAGVALHSSFSPEFDVCHWSAPDLCSACLPGVDPNEWLSPSELEALMHVGAPQRELTHAQRSRLSELEQVDPGARVVGWQGGPLIRRSDGRRQRLVPTGRLNGVRRHPKEALA